MREITARWADNEEIAIAVDTLTAACSFCATAARVPEDVLAVYWDDEGQHVVVACPRCTPTIEKTLDDLLRKDVL